MSLPLPPHPEPWDFIYPELEQRDTKAYGQAAKSEPLSMEEVSSMCRKHLLIHATPFEDAYLNGVRDAERAHNIKAKP